MDHRLRSILLWLAAVLVVVLTGHWYVLPYAIALAGMLLVLHRSAAYRLHPARPIYDLIFIGYLWMVVLVRCRPFRWSTPAEAALNMAEHIGFAVVIGLMAYLVFHLLLRWPARKALLAAILAFNVLGVGNEFFQNRMNGRPSFSLDGDARKDIAMNAVGSVVLAGLLGTNFRRQART